MDREPLRPAGDPPMRSESHPDEREEALVASELRYRRLFESAKDGILILDAETGMVVDANPFLVELLGFSHEQFLGKRVWELGFFKDIVANEANFAQLQQKEYIRYEDMAMEGSDGKRHEVEFVSNVYRVNGHKVIQCNIRDITARKRAEDALHESERRFRETLEGIHLAGVTLDAQGNITFCNDFLLKLTGWERDEVLGKNWFDLFVPPEAAVKSLFVECIATGSFPPHYDNPILTRHGPQRLIAWNNTVLRDPQGNVTGTSSIGEDVTDRRQAEERLRESETLLDHAAAIAGISSLVWDFRADTIISSRHVHALLGVTALDKVYTYREALEAVVHPDDRQRVADEVAAMIDTGRVWGLEIRIVRPDGGERVVRTNGELIRNERGEPTRFVIVLSDITKQKADEERLASMERQLRHANRLATMGELSAGIAHEVNQPLAAIVNFAKASQNLLAQPDADLAQIREWNNAIAQAAARAGEMVRRVRGFARRSEAKLSRVAVEDLVQDSLSLVRIETRAGEVAIATSSSEPGLQVEVHPIQVQQVLVNLLRNAIEAFGDRPERTPRVTVAATGRDGEVEVSVSDNGPGLPATRMNELFAPFFSTKAEGLGLGLAISRTIVESWGGRIWAESNPDGGASFHFTLPRTRGD